MLRQSQPQNYDNINGHILLCGSNHAFEIKDVQQRRKQKNKSTYHLQATYLSIQESQVFVYSFIEPTPRMQGMKSSAQNIFLKKCSGQKNLHIYCALSVVSCTHISSDPQTSHKYRMNRKDIVLKSWDNICKVSWAYRPYLCKNPLSMKIFKGCTRCFGCLEFTEVSKLESFNLFEYLQLNMLDVFPDLLLATYVYSFPG